MGDFNLPLIYLSVDYPLDNSIDGVSCMIMNAFTRQIELSQWVEEATFIPFGNVLFLLLKVSYLLLLM